MRIIKNIRKFLRLSPDQSVNPEVRKHFKRNFITNTLDGAFWLMGDSFISVETILPVFASTLTDSAVLIGLVPALFQAGWFIPQFFMAGQVKKLKQKLPFAKKFGLIERILYFIFPLTAFSLHWGTKELALWLFIFLVACRGLTSGIVALPWQEVIARVIPSPVRSRFFGVSRMLGRGMGLLGSVISGFILAEFAYPNNYGLSFLMGGFFIWISYFFFIRTIEPKENNINFSDEPSNSKDKWFDFSSYKAIFKNDINFRVYLFSRIVFQFGNMATGFLAVYGIQHFSMADEQAAVFSGLISVSGILGYIFWGIYGDDVGPRKVLLISNLIQVLTLVIAFLSRTIWPYYFIFLFFGFAQSGSIIGEMILGMELGKEEERPTYIGLARSLPGFFVLFAPIMGGILIEWLGYRSMFLVALTFLIISMGFLSRVHERTVNTEIL
jgi:MFS family permease